MRFTDDEWMLMMLYSPGTRTGLIEELQKMQKSLTGRESIGSGSAEGKAGGGAACAASQVLRRKGVINAFYG